MKTTDGKGANPLALVKYGLEAYPQYFGPALKELDPDLLPGILAVVEAVPERRMSETSKAFARNLLTFTFGFLMELQQS